MMHEVTERAATSSSFSERVKNTLGNFFPFTMGAVTGDEIDTHEEEEKNGEVDDFESQVSLNSSIHEVRHLQTWRMAILIGLESQDHGPHQWK